jgi:hypothetical protein
MIQRGDHVVINLGERPHPCQNLREGRRGHLWNNVPEQKAFRAIP